MPGFFDFLNGGADPAQQQGLLAAAAQILQASGPSRTPTSFGQIMGGGLGAYQQGVQGAQDRDLQMEQAKQLAQLRGLTIQDKQSDLASQEAQRQRAKGLLSLTSDYWKGGDQPQPPAFTGGQPAASMLQNVLSAQNAGAAQPAQPAPAGAGGGLDRGAMTNQRIAYAQFLRQHGYGAEAQAEEDSALKLQPKVKEWQKVTVGDKVLYAPYFEDGSSGQPVPLEVAEKLVTVNRGGSTDLTNPFTGATVRSMTNSASPEALISAATQRRGQDITMRGQNMTDSRERQQFGRPVFNAEVGGFISPPSATNPGGSLTPLAGFSKSSKMTEDQAKATGWLVQAENAWKNMKTNAYDRDNKLTPAALPGRLEAAASAVPFGMGDAAANMARTPERQKFLQGASSLSESLLRAATGAGVNKDEAQQKVRELTPVWGDSTEVIQQKMDSIPLYIESLKVRAGPGAAKAEGVLNTPPRTPPSIPQGAVQRLRMQPSLRAAFDEKYGEGASASILGK